MKISEREYKEKCKYLSDFSYWDSLTKEAEKDLRKFHRDLRKSENVYEIKELTNRSIVLKINDTTYILVSYYTKVCMLQDGEFYKLWDDYSHTTLNAINIFRNHFKMGSLSKKEWIMMDTLN